MNEELHTLSGAYAVHALPYAEWVLFEEHLLGCPGCWSEVRRLRETAARLAEAVAETPPPGLRGRLLAAAHGQRRPEDGAEKVRDDSPTIWRPPQSRRQYPPQGRPQQSPPPTALPPDTPTHHAVPEHRAPEHRAPEHRAPEHRAPEHRPPERRAPEHRDPPTLGLPPGWQDSPAQGGQVLPLRQHRDVPVREAAYQRVPDAPATPESGAQVVPLRRGRTRALAGVTAVAAAAAIAFGVVAFDARRDLGDMTTRSEELVAVLAAPDAETVRAPVTAGGMSTLVISRSQRRMVFTSSGMPDLPDHQTYALWLMNKDGPRPGGLLEQRPDGLTSPLVLEPLEGDDRVALTIEPAGGSPKPTRQPIMLTKLPRKT